MSIRLMTLVWDKAIPVSRKLLLLSLADQANDAGECWPQLDDLAARCSVSRRTLFECLKELEDGGFIDRRHVGPAGRQRVVFRVNEDALRQCELLTAPEQQPGYEFGRRAAEKAHNQDQASVEKAGAKSAPAQNPHQREICTGAKSSIDPVRNLHPIKQPKQSNPKREEARAPTGTRLPLDWQPSAEDRKFAATERPDLNVDAEAAKFRDYWHGLASPKGRKADWSATWRNWVRRADAPKGGAAPPTGSAPAAPQTDWRKSSETPLQRALAHIRHQHHCGAYGEGPEADAELDRLIADAERRHGPPSQAVGT